MGKPVTPRVYSKLDRLNFGKYKHEGITLAEIIMKDPAYIKWCLENVNFFDIDQSAEELLNEREGTARSGKDHYSRADGVSYRKDESPKSFLGAAGEFRKIHGRWPTRDELAELGNKD